VCESGDLVCDGIVTHIDYSAFESFFDGPEVSVSCPLFDSDADGDIDLRDMAAFQQAYNGN